MIRFGRRRRRRRIGLAGCRRLGAVRTGTGYRAAGLRGAIGERSAARRRDGGTYGGGRRTQALSMSLSSSSWVFGSFRFSEPVNLTGYRRGIDGVWQEGI